MHVPLFVFPYMSKSMDPLMYVHVTFMKSINTYSQIWYLLYTNINRIYVNKQGQLCSGLIFQLQNNYNRFTVTSLSLLYIWDQSIFRGYLN